MASRRLMVLVVAAIHAGLCSDQASTNTLNSHDSNDDSGPSWLYKCIPEKGCSRMAPALPTSPNVSSSLYESVDLCRTVCGRFGGLWPQPTTASLSIQTVKIHPNYLRFDLIDAPPATRELLAEMTTIFTQNIQNECDGNVTTVVETPVLVYLNIKSADLSLNWETDESYMLDVQSRGGDVSVHIVAETIFGARHGLESLSQLIASTKPMFPGAHRHQCTLHLVAGAKIRDRPVYPHRGLMLDTSRNFIPMKDIKRTVDGLAASKMNVLHWHATDSHSFPLSLPTVPLLSKYGAYSASEIYRGEEISSLLRYARARGVRVILEIDSPAHAGNGWQWGKEYGLGELAVCVNAAQWRPLCIQPPCGQLNPTNPHLYDVLRDLYRDIADIFPKGELFHMGGDEVFLPCWNSSSEIVSYLSEQGLDRSAESFVKLWAQFHTRALRIWDEVSSPAAPAAPAAPTTPSPILLWSSELTQPSHITNYLDKERYVIEVWEPAASSLTTQLTRLGYRVVAAPKDRWYLDHGFWGNTRYANWRRMYEHRPPARPLALGGEVALWTEYADANVLDGRTWPRAAAVGERLWSDPSTLASVAEPRMQRHRTRLHARHLRPDVLTPAWCAQNDARCH